MIARLPRLDQVKKLLRVARQITDRRLHAHGKALTGGKLPAQCGIAHHDGTFSYIAGGRPVHRQPRIPSHILDLMPADEAARLRAAGAEG